MFYPSSLAGSAFTDAYALFAASAAQTAAREAQTSTELFKHDIDRLLLITEALWTLMKQEHGYTDDKLVQLIQNIDQRKASAYGPGNATKDPPVACPSCGRPNTAKRTVCMYCGSRLATKPFAR